MASGIKDRDKLVQEMIKLVLAIDLRVREELGCASASHNSNIGVVERVAAHFGILPRLCDIQPHEYLKWIQILRFVCHPDKHVQSIVGVQNATWLFSIIDQCFQHHRTKWIESVAQYVRTDSQRIHRFHLDPSVQANYVRTPKSSSQTSRMNPETLRRFRQTVFEADILDVDSLSVLRRVQDRHRVIDTLQNWQHTDSDDEDLSSSSEEGSALTVEMDGTQEPASADTRLCQVVDPRKRGDGSAFEMLPEVYRKSARHSTSSRRISPTGSTVSETPRQEPSCTKSTHTLDARQTSCPPVAGLLTSFAHVLGRTPPPERHPHHRVVSRAWTLKATPPIWMHSSGVSFTFWVPSEEPQIVIRGRCTTSCWRSLDRFGP